MNHLCCKSLCAGAIGVLIALGAPGSAQAQTMTLKQGWNYAIGFPETGSASPASGVVKGVATYRVLASAGDQQWYRVQMIARKPQGGWYVPPGTPEVWINLSYAMWVQEVLR